MDEHPEIPDEKRTKCEVWTRVMGYHRPISGFNPGKAQEHEDRRLFQEPVTALTYPEGTESPATY